ncbi:nuclear transport factor 2 family protein [uncultured Pelagimonas sp.]|uniref:nuclear transport factor 2 family protein n=1 Tax=uncultured Pelagimonas sp. TaxID=1618102 RepID=UPI00261079D9|nr:nuclear transport factor 2 family protein [uncultured Pelagimonas sp.]
MTAQDLVLAAVAAIFTDFDVDTAKGLLAPDYIQHNTAVPTGADPILGFIPGLEQSGIALTTHRVLSEGDMVVLHNTYANAQAFGAETLVAFDVFRVQDGRVVEHWDNLQVPPTETASGRSMTDGPTEVVDLDLTGENKALVKGFIADVLHGGAPERITTYISPELYLQHNPLVGDGLDGLGAALTAMAEAGQAMAYSETHIVVGQGNFVFAASEGTIGDTPTAFFDLFRVADGKIVEHWDTVSEIPADMAHENGKF